MIGSLAKAGFHMPIIAAVVVPSLLLDTVTVGIAAAYSVRKIKSTYTGALLRVRRSSDNTELDISANASNDLDTTALLAFCGSGHGCISKWYDQSGASLDATQTTAANQPYIVISGSLQTTNSLNKPCASEYVNGGSVLTLNVPNAAWTGLTSSSAIIALTTSPQGGWGNFGSAGEIYTPFGDATASSYDAYCCNSRFGFGPLGVAGVYSVHNSGSSMSVFNNGNSIGTPQSTSFTAPTSGTARRLFAGIAKTSIQEAIFTKTVPITGQRQLIERNMGTYYGVTVA